MQAVLNFSGEEKKELTGFLKGFKALALKSPFEEAKAEIEGCTVTLYKSGKLLVQGKKAEKVKAGILAGVKGENELVLGIDEAGRGENFGPLVVAGVLGETKNLRELRDSKKTRDIAGKAKIVEKNCIGKKIIEISAANIDRQRSNGKNLNAITAEAVNEIIAFLKGKNSGKQFRVVMDGSPIRGVEKAEFLPGADDKIVQVAAASVLAKNARNKSRDKAERKTWCRKK